MKTLVLGAGGLSQNLGVSLCFLGVYYYCLPGNHINKTYPPGTDHISHQTGKGKSRLKIAMGYVGSREGTRLGPNQVITPVTN